MNVKLILAVILLSVFFSSCSSHRFFLFDGGDPLDDNKEFVFQNDSIDIRYRFSGNDIPMNIYIYNKSDYPLFIDWKKSSMILNSNTISYWNQDFYDDRIIHIAPYSYIESTRYLLGGYVPKNLPLEKKQKVKMQCANGHIMVKSYSFTDEESPLWFRSRLIFSSSETYEHETVLESVFWVSQIIESPEKDLFFMNTKNYYTNYKSMWSIPGNMAIVSKVSDAGGFTLSIIALSALVALEVMVESVE